MKTANWDIDIDVNSGVDRNIFGTRAMIYNEEQETINPHPSGVYLDPIPVDDMTGNAAFDHKEKKTQNYIKVDILTNTSYDKFTSKNEVIMMSEKEPNWDLLKDIKTVRKLPHIANHFDLIEELDIQSVDDLADALALIRPGKSHLLETYKENKRSVRRQLYIRPSNGQPYFKKSHAYSYAVMIVTLLNKMDLFRIR